MGLASPVSGDWRPVGQGNSLELVAVLSVNTPGFLCQIETDSQGRPSAMVASLSIADETPAAVGWSLDDLKTVLAQVLAEDRAAASAAVYTPPTVTAPVDKPPAEVDARMVELIAEFCGADSASAPVEAEAVELTPTDRMGDLIAEFSGKQAAPKG